VEDCKRYGTLPFAGLARGAFIAVQMLKSAVACRILSDNDYCSFMNSINTISSQMKEDFIRLSKQGFLVKYGHLRPGTYDICSPRYDEKPNLYFDWSSGNTESYEKGEFKLSIEQMRLLKEKLEECGLSDDVLGLLEFVKSVIEGREYSKFIFTKHVSEILRLMRNAGEKYGLSAEDMSFTRIHSILRLYSSTDDIEDALNISIRSGRKKAVASNLITLPPVIISPEDIYAFTYPDTEPNYITIGQVIGEVVEIQGISQEQEADAGFGDIEGKIVLIKSADPGYDWIFSHKISGFITMYGGANSHMAIRAGELNIPAAVGVGEKLYQTVRSAKVIEINSRDKTIKVFRR
jgi:phosphohistidine swiveling domain-containing protein